MSDDLILEMARRHWAARHDPHRKPWEGLSESKRSSLYDAMWDALYVLKEPGPEMLYEGTVGALSTSSTLTLSPDVDSTKAAWTAMINKLLEVK